MAPVGTVNAAMLLIISNVWTTHTCSVSQDCMHSVGFEVCCWRRKTWRWDTSQRETERQRQRLFQSWRWWSETSWRFTCKGSPVNHQLFYYVVVIVVAKLCSLGLAGYASAAVQTLSSWWAQLPTLLSKQCECFFLVPIYMNKLNHVKIRYLNYIG